jgi:hypothetical protein
MKYKLIAILFGISTIIFWVICYTLPTWLVWNRIVSPKFMLPQFTFAETFFVLSIIKFIFSSTDYRKLYNDIKKDEKR